MRGWRDPRATEEKVQDEESPREDETVGTPSKGEPSKVRSSWVSCEDPNDEEKLGVDACEN